MVKQRLNKNVPIFIWTDDIEYEALDQLCQLATLPILFRHIAVMADVHAGKGSTVGTVIATTDAVVPAAIGADKNCGMYATKTNYTFDQIKDKLPELRHSIERSIPTGFNQRQVQTNEEIDRWKESFKTLTPELNKGMFVKAMNQLGTLGGGNHFIEISLDQDGFVWIVIHSGSRNVGKCLADIHIKTAKELMRKFHIAVPHPDLSYLPMDTPEGKQHWNDSQWTEQYANRNREIMMQYALKDLIYEVEGKKVAVTYIDSLKEITQLSVVEEAIHCQHNYVALEHHYGKNVYVTRKGAIRAREGDMGIIPGSMGAKSYIVRGIGNPESFMSASHGAGRKMSRKKAKETFTQADIDAQLKDVESKKDLSVLDELPGAYKSIDDVMANQTDLVEIKYTLKQVITIKG